MLRKFHQRVELLNGAGAHLRYLPGELARAMIDAGSAVIANENGRVKSVRLLESAQTHALMIGPPTGTCRGVRFTRREMLEESGTRIWQHHPRTYEPPA